ncbi:MAG TPA: hypothetical protein VN253_15890 [Kofleriaceae bacterium]|nr:hypothetical protein [Kofleriaceae bacterium]
MRFRYDQLAKQLASTLLESFGETTTSEEVLADSQHIDIWHLPDEGMSPDGRARLGMFGRMSERACLLESYHEPPDDDELRDCIRKHLSFHHTRRLKAGAAVGGPGVVPLTTCWIVSSGRPGLAMPAFGFAQAEGWPTGTYDTLPGLQLKLAVLTELPRSHETLLVRLLGRGAVLNRALHDLLALPPGSWERAAAFPIFARLRFELPQDPDDRTAEEEELAVTSQKIVEALQREATEKGMAKGAADLAAHQLERRLGRGLREDERARLRERTETLGPDRLGDLVLDLPVDELAAWLADPNAC